MLMIVNPRFSYTTEKDVVKTRSLNNIQVIMGLRVVHKRYNGSKTNKYTFLT